ncbi:MAG: hypothetical protein AAB408_01855 [Patescibacteria group bacterium]
MSLLGTILTQAIIHRQSRRAWGVEFFLTIFLIHVLGDVVRDPTIAAIVTVAAGGATGTAVAIEWRKWAEKQERMEGDGP